MRSKDLLASNFRVFLKLALATCLILAAATVEADPAALLLLVQKARSLEARDRADLAAQVWQQVLISDPRHPQALVALARWSKRIGKNDDANSYLRQLQAVAPDTPALAQLDQPANQGNRTKLDEAGKLAGAGRYENAARVYQEVFGKAPPPGDWSIAYFETLAKTPGGLEPALSALRKLHVEHPEINSYQLSLGKLMTYQPATRRAGIAVLSGILDSGDTGAKAREALRQALLWERSNPAYSSEFEAYLHSYPDSELEAARTALPKSSPSQPVAAGSREEQRGYRALKDGKTAEAQRLFEEAINKDSASGSAHAGLGYVYMKTGDFTQAVKQFELALRASHDNSTLRSSLQTARFWQAMQFGAHAADQGNWKEAVTQYEAAIALRTQDREAQRALGGALLVADSPAQAISYLSSVLKAEPSDQSSWCAFVQAKQRAEGNGAAITAIESVPEQTASTLSRNVKWKAIEAAVFADDGQDERALKIYREITVSDPNKLDVDNQIQLASLALHFGQPEEALQYARLAVDAAPARSGAWELLLSALITAKRYQEAQRVYSRMPAQMQDTAMAHASFLESLASLKESTGDLEGAADLLEKSLDSRSTFASQNARTSIKLHLARLLAKSNRGEEAKTMIASMIDSEPNNVDVWRANLLVLRSLGRQDELMEAVSRIPKAVALRLGTQGDVVALLAHVQTDAGNSQVGIKLLDTYISRTAASGGDALPERLQLAWLLLNHSQNNGRLYSLLQELKTQADLSADQRNELNDLWATWIVRSAGAARASGDQARALALVEKGVAMFPQNADLQRDLAGNLLAAGDMKRAFNVYANWGLGHAQADDFAGAVSAAKAVKEGHYADRWLEIGLAQWPHNVKLLTLAGERARDHGDLKRAELYWKEALNQKRLQADQPVAAPELAAVQPSGSNSLRALLVGADSNAFEPPAGTESLSTGHVQPPDSSVEASASSFQLSSYHPIAAPREDFVAIPPPLDSPASAAHSSLLAASAVAPAGDPLQDKLASLEGRNTPYVGSGMTISGRSGEPGFDRLLIQQANFEASTVLADTLRASFLLQPTFLFGGTSSGTGDALFGRQTTAAAFGAQNADGIAAEVQLSSNSLGLSLGVTPWGFLTHNWTGGLRVTPKHGPITILLERASVKDTMLSYNGARDPVSNQIWGGVMSNTAVVQGRWGSDHAGFYVNGAYQVLDGLNVARNTALNGNIGNWWKVANFSTGNVTVGVNFSDMHYDRNLRYFTFGQGGYFSPQQYFLFSVPVRWTGYVSKNLQYVVSGSLGSQHFNEDASPYYPTDPILQARTNSYYQAYANTGANFSFDARLNWQITPHYLLGGFVTANNSRDYTYTAAGVFLKYTFEERSMDLTDNTPSVPNWRGQQPFLTQ